MKFIWKMGDGEVKQLINRIQFKDGLKFNEKLVFFYLIAFFDVNFFHYGIEGGTDMIIHFHGHKNQ